MSKYIDIIREWDKISFPLGFELIPSLQAMESVYLNTKTNLILV